MLTDGRFLVGTSKLGRRTVFRPAFSNWRTRPEDLEQFASVVQELGKKLARGLARDANRDMQTASEASGTSREAHALYADEIIEVQEGE